MTANHSDLMPWSPPELTAVPSNPTPGELVELASPHLSNRDKNSIVQAMQQQSYEMVATFVWAKASAVLKKQVAALGMDFVGEMLGRPDITQDSDPSTSIADNEAIGLAEDLGIINTTQGLRLKHSLELVRHFTSLEHNADQEQMQTEEAMLLLKTCISGILSHPNFDTAGRFVDFRRALSDRTLKETDQEASALLESPYFFLRTTLSVLLSLIRTGKGAVKEHALGNLSVLLPLLWQKLREPEKWQIGQVYAEVNSDGDRAASAGLKKALIKVHGFDFVPETLRSNTFSEVAARVLAAHFSYNNFYEEKEPMLTLARLGTAIPRPAFAKCMEATLAVWLGNYWGHSYNAEEPATQVLNSLRTEQWEYYLNECLRRDRTVLDKLASQGKTVSRWIELVKTFRLEERDSRHKGVSQLILASSSGAQSRIREQAEQLRESATL